MNNVSNSIYDVCQELGIKVIKMLGDEKSDFAVNKCELMQACNSSDEIGNLTDTSLSISLQVILLNTNTLTQFEDNLVTILNSNLTVHINEGRISLVVMETNTKILYCGLFSVELWKVENPFSDAVDVLVNDFVSCPMVKINASEYTFAGSNQSVYLHRYNKSIDMSKFDMTDDVLTTCISTILDLQEDPKVAPTENHRFDILYKVLDSICTTVSLVCLIVSFIVYCVFRELRNTTGINNMNLIVCLFLAQAFTKFGLWVTYVPLLCIFFGFMIHFFWLATFTCMSVCAFNVFRVFVINSLSVPSFSYPLLFRYVLLTYTVPLVIVALTSIVSMIQSSGNNTGYGERMCFINDSLTSMITFLVPIAVSLNFNIFFFVKTACALRESSQSTASPERSYVSVYIKLFIMLGFTWPLIIIDALLEMSVFSYFALVFSSLQGLYIFLSFMCTRQVWGLLLKFREKKGNRNTSSTNMASY